MNDDVVKPDSVSVRHVDAALVDRYLANEVSATERQSVEDWAAEGGRPRAILEGLRAIVPGREYREIHNDDVETAVRRVQTLRGSGASLQERWFDQATARAWRLRGWVRRAIAGTTLATTAGLAITAWWHMRSVAITPMRIYASGIGQTAHIQLGDGSHVTLAPASRLRVAEGFGAHTRTLSLEGEAFFDVPTTEGTPFIVSTYGGTARVLGTAFDVRAYSEEPTVHVTVVRGRVMMQRQHSAITLSAGMAGHATDSTIFPTAVDTERLIGWMHGQLIFDDVPVAAVLASVGHWYGYEFQIADSALAKRRIVAAFRINDPTETLAALKHLLNVTMAFDGTVVTVQPRSASQRRSGQRDTTLIFPTHVELGK